MPEATQAIVHIVRGGGCQTINRICKQWQYLSQNGSVQLRRSERYGGGLMEIGDFEAQARTWAQQTGKYIDGHRLSDGHQELTTHIIVSFPRGTNEEDAHAAGRAWAEAMFGLGRNHDGDGSDDASGMFPQRPSWPDRPEWDYVTAFHTNRPHPHLHIVVNRRALSARGEWLAISHRNRFLNYDTMREGLADLAYEYGITLEATSREQRGLEGHGPTREQYRHRANIEFRNHFEEQFETVDTAGELEVFPELSGARGGEDPLAPRGEYPAAGSSSGLIAHRDVNDARISNLELGQDFEETGRARSESGWVEDWGQDPDAETPQQVEAEEARRRQRAELRRQHASEDVEVGPSRRRTPAGVQDVHDLHEPATVTRREPAIVLSRAQLDVQAARDGVSATGNAVEQERANEFEQQRRQEIARDRARRETEGLERSEERRRTRIARMHGDDAGLANVEMPGPDGSVSQMQETDVSGDFPPHNPQGPPRRRGNRQHFETRGMRIRRMAEERRTRNVETRAQRRARLTAEAEARRLGPPSIHAMGVRNTERRQGRQAAQEAVNGLPPANSVTAPLQHDTAENAALAPSRRGQRSPTHRSAGSRPRRNPNAR